MTPLRKLLAYGALAFLALGQLTSIALRRDLWPFSWYPMYAGSFTRSLQYRGLYGVTETGQEVRLDGPSDFTPFHFARINAVISQAEGSDNPQQHLREVGRYLGQRYTALRNAGRHQGPPIRAIRIYLLTWELQSGAANAGSPTRQLLQEIPLEDRP